VATDLIPQDKGEGFILTRFAGGIARGTCYQITVDGVYVQLTEAQMRTMLMAFCADAMGVTVNG